MNIYRYIYILLEIHKVRPRARSTLGHPCKRTASKKSARVRSDKSNIAFIRLMPDKKKIAVLLTPKGTFNSIIIQMKPIKFAYIIFSHFMTRNCWRRFFAKKEANKYSGRNLRKKKERKRRIKYKCSEVNSPKQHDLWHSGKHTSLLFNSLRLVVLS